MAELAKKINIKKNDTIQTAKIYTTVAETGSTVTMPIKVDGVQGYVGLVETTNTLATSLRVKKTGATYGVASAGAILVPTGSTTITGTQTFTVPAGITILKVVATLDTDYYSPNDIYPGSDTVRYIKVTPSKKYCIRSYRAGDYYIFTDGEYCCGRVWNTKNSYNYKTRWFLVEGSYGDLDADSEIENWEEDAPCTISWSPEINKVTPNYDDSAGYM